MVVNISSSFVCFQAQDVGALLETAFTVSRSLIVSGVLSYSKELLSRA